MAKYEMMFAVNFVRDVLIGVLIGIAYLYFWFTFIYIHSRLQFIREKMNEKKQER